MPPESTPVGLTEAGPARRPPDRLPSYAELAHADPPHSAWSIPGIDPRLGMLSLLDEEAAANAFRLVRRGKQFRLDAALDLFDPPLFGRSRFVHDVVELDNIFDEILSGWSTQVSSKWDGFRHVRHPVAGFFGGLAAAEHGVGHWARHGIVGRGVLVDVAAYRASVGRPLRPDAPDPIEVEDLVEALARTGTTLGRGDVLLVRTGWLDWYRTLDTVDRIAAARVEAAVGLRTCGKMIEFLWDQHISAVAADNPALEVWPAGALIEPSVRAAARTDRGRLSEVFMHFALIPLLGIPIGELWDLGPLAADCAVDGRYEFLLMSAPMPSMTGVASPPNAIAVK
ncbi:cyclase family protein [Rhizomonospora bruguierae]|uniref:cyclase family protein n=1 Tax=Rhizomonospora bruguierae TaxID=1581705 RepID=UPI001BD19047|nr:cyclase family protein [Micromonospora sp. NBRC 107566]